MISSEISTVFLFCIFGTIYAKADFQPQPYSIQSGPVIFPSFFQPQQQSPQLINPILPFPQSPCQTKGSVLLGNKCILIESTELNWSEANRYCSQLGYKLMEITSGEDYFRFISYLRSRGLFASSYWVGAAKLNNLFWSWISKGLPIHTTFWAVTIVNGKGIKEPLPDFYQAKTCGFLDKQRAHFLNTENCQAKHRFVCERDLKTGGHPGLIPSRNSYTKLVEEVERLWGAIGIKIIVSNDSSSRSSIPQQPWWPTFFEGGDGNGDNGDNGDGKHYHTCLDGWQPSTTDTKCYKFEKNNPKTWVDARDDCVALGGFLAVIQSEAENQEIEDLAAQYDDCWIGLFSDTAENLAWVDASASTTFLKWANGEPNPKAATCASFLSNGEWKGNMCSVSKGYICQRDE